MNVRELEKESMTEYQDKQVAYAKRLIRENWEAQADLVKRLEQLRQEREELLNLDVYSLICREDSPLYTVKRRLI